MAVSTGMAGSPRGGSTDSLKIVANIFISFLGAGILGLPFAFKRAGLLEGILVMSLVSFFSVKAMLLIIASKYKILEIRNSTKDIRTPRHNEKVRSANGKQYVEIKCSDLEEEEEEDEVESSKENNNKGTENNKKGMEEPYISRETMSYSDIGFAAFGITGRTLIDLSIVTSQIGFCCAYLIFITENLGTFVGHVDKNQWLAILLPPLFMLTLIKDLSSFAVFSLIAQVSNLLGFSIVYWFDFQHLHLAQVDPKEFSLEGLPYFFSVAIYCFEGAGMILSLEESLAVSIRDRFRSYLVKTITGITALYITFGAAGYLSYGNQTRDIITLNLPNDVGFNFAVLVKSFLCFSLFFTYPMMLFPVFSLLERKLDLDGTCFRTGLRLFIVLLTGLIVIRVPNFGDLMALVGATCCTLLAFIMPALCHLMLFRTELSLWERLQDYTLLLLGATGTLVGTLDTVFRKH